MKDCVDDCPDEGEHRRIVDQFTVVYRVCKIAIVKINNPSHKVWRVSMRGVSKNRHDLVAGCYPYKEDYEK